MFGLGNKKKQEEMTEGVIFSTQSETQDSSFVDELEKYKETALQTEQSFDSSESEDSTTLQEEDSSSNGDLPQTKESFLSKLFKKKEKQTSSISDESEIQSQSEDFVKTDESTQDIFQINQDDKKVNEDMGVEEASQDIELPSELNEEVINDSPTISQNESLDTTIESNESLDTDNSVASLKDTTEVLDEKKESLFSKFFKKKDKGPKTTESEDSVKMEENTTNIFEDFTSNDALKEDVKKLEENKNRDSIYYISLVSNIIKTFNTIFLVLVLVLVSYVYIQKREEPLGFSFLNPLCGLIIGDVPYEKYGNCEGVKVMKKLYEKDINETKERQYNGISLAIGDIYTRENFLFSKEVTFLIDRSRNRVTPLKVIAQFDKRKNQFEGIEKSRIQCKDIAISEESILTMSCDAFSSDWEKGFIGFDANKSGKMLEGTSITAANSFLNFLELNAPEFAIMNRQKNFTIENVTSEGYYTKKTSFKLELKFDRTSL